MNRNLNVPCGCPRNVISGPNMYRRPFPTAPRRSRRRHSDSPDRTPSRCAAAWRCRTTRSAARPSAPRRAQAERRDCCRRRRRRVRRHRARSATCCRRPPAAPSRARSTSRPAAAATVPSASARRGGSSTGSSETAGRDSSPSGRPRGSSRPPRGTSSAPASSAPPCTHPSIGPDTPRECRRRAPRRLRRHRPRRRHHGPRRRWADARRKDDHVVLRATGCRRRAPADTRPRTGTRTARADSASSRTASSRRTDPPAPMRGLRSLIALAGAGRRRRLEADAELRRQLLAAPPTLDGSGDVERAGRRCCSHRHLAPGREQPVHRDERVVRPRGSAAYRGRRRAASPSRRRLLQPVQLLERAVEAVEHAIELHAHLERERPAGVVVRAASAGRPDTGMSSGWSCGSNMSSTCGRNACAVFTTYEPAG